MASLMLKNDCDKWEKMLLALLHTANKTDEPKTKFTGPRKLLLLTGITLYFEYD